jgi:hypothetical protein
MISLTDCATVASKPGVTTVCPPVVEYHRDFHARAADELDLLPEGSAIAEMLSDYSVMRDQAPACDEHFGRGSASSARYSVTQHATALR